MPGSYAGDYKAVQRFLVEADAVIALRRQTQR
jgi:hypothetical protein